MESRGESQTYMAEELWGGVGLWVERDGGERRGEEKRRDEIRCCVVYESVSSGLFVELRILLMYPVALASGSNWHSVRCESTEGFKFSALWC